MNQIAKNVKKDHILYICSSSLIFLLVISALVLSHTTLSAHADDSVITTTSITVSESCSMTGTVDTPHTAELPNGTYSGTNHPEGIGTTTLKAFCNDGMGFAIYAIGYTDDIYGYTTLHSEEIGSNYDISTALYQTGNTNSSWSMKLTSIPGDFAPTIANGTNEEEDFTTWHVVPNDYQKVAYKTTGTDILVNNVGTGSSLTVTYDAYISPTQPAGTYVGQVKYTLVHPSTESAPTYPGAPLDPLPASECPANAICYAPNFNDVLGTMVSSGTTEPTLTAISSNYPAAAKQTQARNASGSTVAITSNSTAELIAPNYKREGYGFAGWSTSFDATSATNPVIYGPNETVSTNPQDARGLDVSSGAILYPVWIAKEKNVTMQTFNSTNYPAYNSAPNGTVIALEDERDHDVYAVAKLADGNWWMIENLRLDNNANITTSNTQSNNGSFGGVFTGLPASEDANFTNSTVANSLYSTTNITGNNQGYRFPRYNNNNTNATAMGGTGVNASNTSLYDNYNANNTTVSWYSYGNYYTWAAAMASTIHYTNYNGTGTAGSDSAGTSICPTGWRLPLGIQRTTTDKSFSKLDYNLGGNGGYQSTAVASNRWRTYPNNFIYSGCFGESSTYSRGSYGRYWSSSASDSYNAYNLYFGSISVYPGTSNLNKSYGFSVRCISE